MEPSAKPEPPLMAAPTVWVLTDPVTGHASQSLGVAEALGWPFQTRAMHYRPWAKLPGLLGPARLCGLARASRAALAPPWPDIVVATGRRLGGVARWLKRRAASDGKRVFLAQMMDPVHGRDDFDLIAAPEHDALAPRDNLFVTLGAPTRVSPARLAEAAAAWQARLDHLPRPKIALLVGGDAGRRRFTPAQAAELGQRASALAQAAGGSLLITTSRRTGEAAAEALSKAVAVPAYVHRWAPEGENPYYAFLGSCDALVVTGESVSMASEAVAAGKPLFIYAPRDLVKPAFRRFHEALYQRGLARPLADGAVLDGASTQGLRTAAAIADEIRRRR